MNGLKGEDSQGWDPRTHEETERTYCWSETAREGTPGPRKKRADLQLVKSIADSKQELAKTGGGRKTASRRMARAAHTCNDVYQVEKQGLVRHSRSASRNRQSYLDTQGSRIDNELGKWDYVTSTALEQGCEVDEVADTLVEPKVNENIELPRAVVVQRQAPTAQTLLNVHKLSSRGSSTRSSTSLSRCRGRNPVSQTLSANHKNSTVKGFRRSWRFPRSEDSEGRGDVPVSVRSQDGR